MFSEGPYMGVSSRALVVVNQVELLSMVQG